MRTKSDDVDRSVFGPHSVFLSPKNGGMIEKHAVAVESQLMMEEVLAEVIQDGQTRFVRDFQAALGS
jgi:hypothetical protein